MDSDQPIGDEGSSIHIGNVRIFHPKLRSIQRTQQDEDTAEFIQQNDYGRELSRSITEKARFASVRVQFAVNRWMAIEIKDKFATCGWLLSEVIRKLIAINLDFDASNIIGFKTQNIHLDYYLSCLHNTVPSLDGVILMPMISQPTKEPVDLSCFEIIKKIGAGGFSVVYLVRKLDNGVFYAMKSVDKRLMLERDKEELIFNERLILSKLNHRRLIQLYYAFQTKTKLFFVLDYCPGGELYYQLRKAKRFSEDQAKWVLKQVVQGLDYLHQSNIIYRDLKPENILIDSDGNLKIADLGLSKIVNEINQTNYSFCGSFEYMAPEMILQNGHDFTVDYYMLGIMLFELVAGLPPFYAKTRADMISNIVNKPIHFPNFFTKQLQDLITKLCCKDKLKRLGKNGVQEILQHPWCNQFNKQMPLQFQSNEFNFDKMFTNQNILDIESGPRCLSEEFNLQQHQKTQSDKSIEYGGYDNFASFYFKR